PGAPPAGRPRHRGAPTPARDRRSDRCARAAPRPSRRATAPSRESPAPRRGHPGCAGSRQGLRLGVERRRLVGGDGKRRHLEHPPRDVLDRLRELLGARGTEPPLSRCAEPRSVLGTLSFAIHGSLAFQLHVLVGPREPPGAEKTEPGLLHPWPDAVEEGEVPDRREHRPLVDELLYSVENHLTLRPIQLGGLLPEEAIDVGVAPIGVGAAGDGEGFEPRRSVPRRTDEQVNEVLVSLFRDALEERRALERAPGWRPDARACRARATSDRTDRRRSASGWTGTRPST